MIIHLQKLVGLTCIALCTMSCAINGQDTSDSEAVVTRYFEFLAAGDSKAIDPLFFRIAEIDDNEAAWLALLERVSQIVEDDQLVWEVVCSKELSATAVVIVNQTQRQGRPHGDPDAIFLVRENNSWLILPDLLANNARDEVQRAMSNAQIHEQSELRAWALGEIRGLTTVCRETE